MFAEPLPLDEACRKGGRGAPASCDTAQILLWEEREENANMSNELRRVIVLAKAEGFGGERKAPQVTSAPKRGLTSCSRDGLRGALGPELCPLKMALSSNRTLNRHRLPGNTLPLFGTPASKELGKLRSYVRP